MPATPAPDPLDLAVVDLAQRVMSGYDSNGYRIEHRWSEPAGMWFTEIEPVGSEAANISLYCGGETLNLYFGSTWFEYFGFSVDDLPEIEGLLRAVCDGNLEQAGTKDRSYARIHTAEKIWRVGHAHLPWPWKWRRTKRFPPYAR